MEFLQASGVLFWTLVTLVMIFTFVAYYNDQYGWSFTLLIGTLIFLQLCTDAHPLRWVAQNPVTFLGGLVGYAVLGFPWSLFKWVLMGRDRAVQLAQRIRDITAAGGDPSKDWQVKQWSVKPKAIENLNRITAWWLLWPISVVLTVFGDLLARLVREAVLLTHKVYDALMDWAYQGVPEIPPSEKE